MTPELFEATLQNLMTRNPFKPFTIELLGGKRFEIDYQGAVAWHGGNGFFWAPAGIPVIFDSQSVLQISDTPAHSAP